MFRNRHEAKTCAHFMFHTKQDIVEPAVFAVGAPRVECGLGSDLANLQLGGRFGSLRVA